jgi:hypothetical protein
MKVKMFKHLSHFWLHARTQYRNMAILQEIFEIFIENLTTAKLKKGKH